MDIAHRSMPLFISAPEASVCIYSLLPGRGNDGQTFVSFRRFYFLIFGGNLICPSLTLPARKVKERSPSPITRSPMDFAFSNVFRAGNISDGQMMH